MNAHLKGIGGHHSASARTDVWLTPPYVLDAVGGAGSFDLDPCAPADRPWPTAAHHLTENDNGLIHRWHGRVWLNPPYKTGLVDRFMGRMAEHGRGIALIFARTETAFFQRHVWETADALLFLEGRLNFHHIDGSRAPKNAGAPSVLCAYSFSDADCLAGSGLAGAFVPLRFRAFIAGFSSPRSWMDEISDWMRGAGDDVALADIYRAFAGSAKAVRNPNYQAKIRQILQRGPFIRVDRGLWRFADKPASPRARRRS